MGDKFNAAMKNTFGAGVNYVKTGGKAAITAQKAIGFQAITGGLGWFTKPGKALAQDVKEIPSNLSSAAKKFWSTLF